MLGAITVSQAVCAHSDKEKARFVAESGVDTGTCNNRFRPCASIRYAVQQANKGDSILVAAGSYHIQDEQELLYLVSELQPVFGGFSTIDNYQVQQPSTSSTTLIGVPLQYAETLYAKGFDVIVDTKGLASPTLDAKLDSVQRMTTAHGLAACVDGQAAGFECNNISLLAHLPLSSLPTNSSSANDIWGHVDLNTMREYAIIGLRRGIAVVEVTDPENPVVVGSVNGQSTTWRDIKVYQYYSTGEQRWLAYAYAGADSVTEGLTIIDLTGLPESISLANRTTDDTRAHNVYISNVDYTTNTALTGRTALLHAAGTNNFGGAWRSFSFKDPINPDAEYSYSSKSSSRYYTHDASSVLIDDQRAERDCTDAENGVCNVMLDFNEDELILWDHTLSSKATELGKQTYPNAQYVHSGWWSEDKQYVILHDELDEQRVGINTTVHFFDISDLNAPLLVSSWEGPTRAIDHNGFVRGDRYYMSNYERGVTILDISNPLAPQEVGYFDTFGTSNSPSFNGTWGVYPYLPSGIILASDIQGGLYILRDETRNDESNRVGFATTQAAGNEGEELSLTVSKIGSGAMSVDYQIVTGSATASDIEFTNGSLTWSANDNSDRSISITLNSDSNEEHDELFFVRLSNPSGGSLEDQNLAFATINGSPIVRGIVGFEQNEYIVKEIDGVVNLEVFRNGGADQSIEVDYTVTEQGATLGDDVEVSNGTLTWSDGDNQSKQIVLTILNDDESEGVEQLQVTLSANDPSLLSESVSTVVSIRDDEVNLPPAIDAGADINVNTRQTVILNAIATDPEEQPMTFSWQQTGGTSVTLSEADTLSPRFSAPTSATTIELQVTAEDDFGTTSTDTIVITVTASNAEVITSNNSSGGTLYWLLGALLALVYIRKRK